MRLLDTTSRGWILAQRGIEGSPSPLENSALLPIRITGAPSDPVNTAGATGVDDFSIGCDFPGPEVQDKIWIMAPLTEGQTKFTLKSPLNPNTELNLKLASEGIGFNGAAEKKLTAGESEVLIECRSSNSSTRDAALDLSLGTVPSESKPIGVKIMKDRTVRVKPFLITKRTVTADPAHPGQNLVELNPPDVYPTTADLQTYLNAVFEPQLNTRFIVVEPTELQLEWDTLEADGKPNGSPDAEDVEIPGAELQPMRDLAADYTGDADITLFYLGTDKQITLGQRKAVGLTMRNINTCWIVADPLGNPAVPGSWRLLSEVKQTIAHEIGHVVVGYGHPGAPFGEDPGLVPLTGTNHLERLMVGGDSLPPLQVNGMTHSMPRKHRLVKGEWDQAEIWLSTRQRGDR